jgi:hypothetical protein
MRAIARNGLLAAIALSAGACASATADRPCDPFMSQSEPIRLGEIVAVGRDAEGTLYVVDRPAAPANMRVFLSEGETLVRRRLIGGGSVTETGLHRELFSVEDTPEPFRLIVEIGAGETRMAIAPLSEERIVTIDGLGSAAVLLEVLSDEAVAGMALQDLPGTVELEYLARSEDGALLVVGRPAEDGTYEDFRLFFGPEQRLAERTIWNVVRQRDGGTTHIEFDLGGEDADAFFPITFMDDQFQPGPATLTIGGETMPLTRLAASELPDGAAFVCF